LPQNFCKCKAQFEDVTIGGTLLPPPRRHPRERV